MHVESTTSPRPPNRFGAVAWATALFVAALLAVIVVAVHREGRPNAPTGIGTPMTERGVDRPPMSAAEEAFATALWTIHAQVREDAVRMTFAGLSYKMGDIDASTLEARVAPLGKKFDDAVEQIRQLVPPPELAAVHQRYESAVRRYGQASRTMLQTGASHRDQTLLQAQQLSMQSSEDLLRVSDVLWPGEHKPN